ncbi:MAG: sortase [Patescibacteria group bacterium]|nr:sortase [Patescibacteria group bacterium]
MVQPITGVNFLPRQPRGLRFLRRGSLALIIASAVLLVYPFWGILAYHWNTAVTIRPVGVLAAAPARSPKPVAKPTATPQPSPRRTILTPLIAPFISPTPTPTPKPTPKSAGTTVKGNRLVIPKINVSMPITEGLNGAVALRQGAWRLPGTSTPDVGSNTVIGGHRWLYRPPSSRTFYLLDQVEVGDSVTVTWNNETYDYRVKEVKIVLPSQVEILNPTVTPTLTLFTCTPLFSSAHRLVVVAEQI